MRASQNNPPNTWRDTPQGGRNGPVPIGRSGWTAAAAHLSVTFSGFPGIRSLRRARIRCASAFCSGAEADRTYVVSLALSGTLCLWFISPAGWWFGLGLVMEAPAGVTFCFHARRLT